MADENISNGVPVEKVNDQVEEREDFFHSENHKNELTQKIEALEKEKTQLLHETEEIKGKVEDMVVKIDGMKKDKAEMNEKLEAMKIEIEVVKEGKSVMESTAARTAELETEVSQLQHDLVSAKTKGKEANAEISRLQKTLEEKEERIQHLEKEVVELKKAVANSEKHVKDLEKKIGVLEVRESELKSEKIRVREEMREKIYEKEAELVGQKKKVEDLELVIAKDGAELKKCIEDKGSTEEALRLSKENVRALELKIGQMQNQVGEAEKEISIMEEKNLEFVNGIPYTEIIDKKGSKVQWPMVAMGSTGVVIAVAAVAFALHSRQR